jgi:hypothetical protein
MKKVMSNKNNMFYILTSMIALVLIGTTMSTSSVSAQTNETGGSPTAGSPTVDVYKWTFNSPDGKGTSTLVSDAETAKTVATSLALMNLNSQRGPVTSAGAAGTTGGTDDTLAGTAVQTSGALVAQVQQQVSQGIDGLVETAKATEQIAEGNPAAGSFSIGASFMGVGVGIGIGW